MKETDSQGKIPDPLLLFAVIETDDDDNDSDDVEKAYYKVGTRL